jgi:hypothetical protein
MTKWSLFNMPGSRKAARQLDIALAEALKRLDRNVELGTPIEDAARGAFAAVSVRMSELAEFGASDSEPRDWLGVSIAAHVNANHGTRLWVDRFGRVSRLDPRVKPHQTAQELWGAACELQMESA